MKKNLRMICSIVLTFMIALVLIGCAQQAAEPIDSKSASDEAPQTGGDSPQSSDTVKVGVCIAGNKSGFMQYVVSGMYKYRDEAGGVEVLVVYADDQPEKQNAQVDNFIGQGVDAIILQPCDLAALEPAVDAANKADVPILTVNTPVGNQEKCLAYIGSDSVESGELQVERICEQLNYKGNLAVLQGRMGHPAQIDRLKGYENVVNKYPEMKIVFAQTANWDTEEAQSITENWLETDTKIDGFLCHCDTIAIGVLNALEGKGKKGTALIGGMDCMPEVMDLIAEGDIDNSIWQDGTAQGYAAVEAAVKAAKGEQVGDVLIPYEVCIKDNLQQYLDKAKERDELSNKYF